MPSSLPTRQGALLTAVLAVCGLAAWWALSAEPPPSPPASPMPCGSCHEAIVTAWKASNHASAQRLPGPDDPTHVTLDGVPNPVQGVIGVEPLVQYLVPGPAGALQVTTEAWDVNRLEAFEAFEPPAPPGSWGHWTGGGMTWNRSCASCHATEVRKGFDGEGYATTYTALGVDCAACHGDATAHATGAPPPQVADDRWLDVCAACHARRAELTDGYVPGAPFLDHFAPQLVDGVRLDFAGQIRDEVFEWTPFVGSRMHAAGVTCTDCHAPHSGRLRAEGDALCRGCHDGLGTEPHDLHEAPRSCVDCHMPVTTYMARDPRHDHGFVVPDPAAATALGLRDPCLACHEGDAILEAFAQTYGEGRGRDRARVLAEARAGAPTAVDDLLPLLATGAPAWRAAAMGVSDAFVADPRVQRAVVTAAIDADALVRFGAVATLARWGGPREALRSALADPRRAVRLEAQRGLAAELHPTSPEAADLRAYLDHNRDQPEALVERGLWHFAHDETIATLDALDAAIALDPTHVGARDARSVVYAAMGLTEGAVADLEVAVAQQPDDDELAFRLGLALAQAGRTDEAIARWQALRPRHLRAAYNLGLLLAEQERYVESLKVLFDAEALGPDDVDLRYAIASVLWRWGRPDEARLAARRVLALDADHEGARALLAIP